MTDIEPLHDLPRCPFCGAWPTRPENCELGVVYCGNQGCPICGVVISEDKWRQRPLEAEYDADLLHAAECYTRMQANLEQARQNVSGLLPLIDSILEQDRKAGRI